MKKLMLVGVASSFGSLLFGCGSEGLVDKETDPSSFDLDGGTFEEEEETAAARPSQGDKLRHFSTIADAALHEHFVRQLPNTLGEIQVGTFINALGDREVVAVDENGERVDLEEALEAEEAARDERCGALETSFCDSLLTDQESTEATSVAIWLRVDLPDLDFAQLDVDSAGFQSARAEWLDSLRSSLSPALDALRASAPGRQFELDAMAPVAYATLTARDLRTVSRLPFVDRIYSSGGEMVSLLADSLTTTNWAPVANSDGTGVKVGVLEQDAPNALLNLPTLTIRKTNDTLHDHAIGVIGTIANTRFSDPRGFAPDVQIFLANFLDNENMASSPDIQWGVAQGVNVFNESQGLVNARTTSDLANRDRYVDFVTRTQRKLFVRAAGNIIYSRRHLDTDYVANKSYNALIVGGTYENGTIMNGRVPTTESCIPERMSSAFRNDTNGQELPNLVAVGSCVKLWNNAYYTGTSIATPQVTGIVAGLMEYNGRLADWPEGLKAIMLASPYGAGSRSPDGCDWAQAKNASGTCVAGDGRDGTGLVNGVWAKRMAEPTKKLRNNAAAPSSWGHDYGTMTTSEFDPTTNAWSSAWFVKGGASCTNVNRRLRVAIAWDTNPVCNNTSGICTGDALRMNVDLRVYRGPDNVLVGQSETTANSYEHIDIPILEQRLACNPSAPNYVYKIVARLANRSTLQPTEATPFGIAWHTYLP